MSKQLKSGIIKELLNDNTKWNFWSKDWMKVCRVKWNGKTPFKEVKKAAREFLQIKDSEMMYERSIGNLDPHIILD